MFNYVDISGFGHSGKTVVADLLREFDGFWVPDNLFEFDLIRAPGGIIDLNYALVDNWSLIRSDAAIRRFKKIAQRMGINATLKSPFSIFKAYGTNYQNLFNKKFFNITDNYINSLVDYQLERFWPYPLLESSNFDIFNERISRLLFKNYHQKRKIFTTKFNLNFSQCTKIYLDSLYSEIVPTTVNSVVLLNAAEPFNPSRLTKIIDNLKVIIVIRDPRDIYASFFLKNSLHIPDFDNSENLWAIKKSMLNTDNIDCFIKQQKLLFSNIRSNKNSKNILNLSYEEIILNYDVNLEIIMDFLSLKPNQHINPRKYFSPNISFKNIGLWKLLPDQRPINRIAEELNAIYFSH